MDCKTALDIWNYNLIEKYVILLVKLSKKFLWYFVKKKKKMKNC